MILKWSQSGHRTSGNEPIGLDRRRDPTARRRAVTCGNAIIGGTRSHAKTPNFGSSSPPSPTVMCPLQLQKAHDLALLRFGLWCAATTPASGLGRKSHRGRPVAISGINAESSAIRRH
jgi:hypothetical protein